MGSLKYTLRKVQAKPPLVWGRWIKQSPYAWPQRILGTQLGLCAKPDFLIIGTQRAGTTSLYKYLVKHPLVKGALKKEVHFFDLGYERGWRWYGAHFPLRHPASGRFITGEASPYYLFHPAVPERVAGDIPDVKLVAMLRNPVERAYSHYHHAVMRGNESLSFDEAIARERRDIVGVRWPYGEGADYSSDRLRHHSYLARGMYAAQLERWFERFPQERILLLKSESFFANPDESLARTLAHLELPAWTPGRFLQHNVGRYTEISEATRRQLAEFFAPHNQRLAALTGWDLDDWA